MIPVQVSGSIGWLHLPEKRPSATRGVVLCATLGNEAMNVHRAWVMLAETLAASGLPTLRFDYPGTGDSVMNESEGLCLADWTRSITDAAAWLQANAGVTEIYLCGLRAGAALATIAAPLVPGLAGLALLAPVVSGRSYMREQVITARAWDAIWMVNQPIEQDCWFEAAGLRVPISLKRDLDAIDLRKLPTCPAPRVLVMDPVNTLPVQAVTERLATLGAEVAGVPFPGYEALLRDALYSEVPHAAHNEVAAWMTAEQIAGEADPFTTPAVLPCLDLNQATEAPVRFGPDSRLFGVFCAPRGGFKSIVSLLILNTGGHRHVGHSRFAVSFARRLAELGIPSLRMDASGIGDSDPGCGDAGQFYDASGQTDGKAAIDWLVAAGGGKVVVLGLCSGAYTALHLGVQDERIAGIVVGNLQRFVWTSGTSLRVVQRTTRRTTRFYMENIGSKAVWHRLLRADIDVFGIGRTLAGRVLRRVRSRLDSAARPARKPEPLRSRCAAGSTSCDSAAFPCCTH